jgi:Zn-dependent protease
MFGIPIRVHPMFWLVSAVLGWRSMQEGFSFLLLWIACMFVSILVHELGHVFAYRWFGADGHVVLYSFGGLAISRHYLANRWQRVAVSFAGPWAGFVFIGLVVWLVALVNPDLFSLLILEIKDWLGMPLEHAGQLNIVPPSLFAIAAVSDLFQINVFWGLLNLLPIWPLDGGQISRELFEANMRHGNGTRTALGVSGGVATLLAINSLAASYGQPLIPFLKIGGMYMVLFFGLLAVSSFQAMQQLPASRPWHEEHPSDWERDREYWERDRDRDRWER